MRTSSIRLRANARLAILHEDYLEICDGNMLAAMLLSVLVYWTDIKIAKKEENRWVWKTHEDFQEDLLFNRGMKAPHRTTISNALDVLRAKDFIQWRKNPKLALDRTRQYLVNLEEVQAAIDRLPAIVSRKTDNGMSENRHSTEQATEATPSSYTNVEKPTHDECRNNDNALSEKQHCNVEKPTSNTNDYNTEITVPEITEDEGANAPAALINFAERKTESDKHKAVTTETPYHIATSGYGKDDEPTEKRAAVKPLQHTPAASVSLSLAVIPPHGGCQDDTGGRQARLSTGTVPITPAAPVGMSVTGTPPASLEARQGGLKIVRKAVTQEKLSMKEDSPVIRQETPAQILKRQERRRDEILALYGQEIGRKPSRSRDNLAGALLCAQDDISDEDIKTTIKEILKDPFMAKQMDMKYVYEKLDVFAGKLPPPEQARSGDYSDFDIYVGNGKEERAARLKLFDEMVANGQIDIAI